MKVTLEQSRCTVEREPSDPMPRGGSWGSAESHLYHQIKLALQKQGFDVIKKRIQSDGHMYGDETLPYIRERNHAFYIYDGEYAIRNIVEQYKQAGKVTLLVQHN